MPDVTAWDLLGIAPGHPGGRNAPRPEHAAIIGAAEAWRQRLTSSLVRMQDLDDTEQALIDALAVARCGQCRQCDGCHRDAPFAKQ